MAALTTFVPRLGGPRCDANVTWTSTGALAENGRRGYTGSVRKFNYGDSIPLEAERAVKTTIGRCCECIGFRAARIASPYASFLIRGHGYSVFPNGRTTICVFRGNGNRVGDEKFVRVDLRVS